MKKKEEILRAQKVKEEALQLRMAQQKKDDSLRLEQEAIEKKLREAKIFEEEEERERSMKMEQERERKDFEKKEILRKEEAKKMEAKLILEEKFVVNLFLSLFTYNFYI